MDETSPGGTIALMLIFLQTNDCEIIKKLPIPQTKYELDHIRPDFLSLRIIGRSLIMWDSIKPTQEWIKSQVPSMIINFIKNKPINIEPCDENIELSYFHIIAGACFAISLKFAGTRNNNAFELLLFWTEYFITLTQNQGC